MKLAWLSLAVLTACAVEPSEPVPVDDPFADKSAWDPQNAFHPSACAATNLADLSQYIDGRAELAVSSVSFLARERTGATATCTDASCFDWKSTLAPTLWLASPLDDLPAHAPVALDGGPSAMLENANRTVSLRFAWPEESVEASCIGFTPDGKTTLECTLSMRIEDRASDLMFPTRPDDIVAPSEAKLVGTICDDGRFHLASDDFYGTLAPSGRVGLALWGRL